MSTAPDSASSAKAGLIYLEYIMNTWLTVPLWRSWLQYGRIQAAQIRGVTLNMVASTTNHLEALNRVLKRKHINHFKKGG